MCDGIIVDNYCTTCGFASNDFVIQNIQKLFIPSRVDLNMLRRILPMEDSEFNFKISDLADRFGLKIELEMLIIPEDKKQDFISALIKEL
ncbi:MAG: hypothetical protein ACFFG0_14460 [Candidatus Thorarchaeota archaeon]